MLEAALSPRSVAVIGASDNPHKVGGRPILYMQRYGFRGAIYPINPGRSSVQGLRAFARLDDLPEVPELAIVAVAGEEAVRAVEACAARGVRVAVVMASGFGETGPEGLRVQQSLVETARRAGMRLIGPNCQGLANFATGVVTNFSTIFHELEGRDGPVAIVSQSGANSQAIYALLHGKGLGVRHVHATGNEADVTVADVAAAVLGDPGVRLLLLYMEAIADPQGLAVAAEAAREKGIPIVALKAGRTARGQKAASSHTGALAAEDRVVDAFFERHGIWRTADPHELVAAAALYISGPRPRGKRLVFVSNSGASCVMAADYAEEKGFPLAVISPQAKTRLASALPGFAALDNPIDVTGALLGSPQLLGAVLPAIGEDAQSDLLLLALPVAGTGYDVPRFARDLKSFQDAYGHAVAVAAPQEPVRKEFEEMGIAGFAREREAMDALAQVAAHTALLRRPAREPRYRKYPAGPASFLDEAQSLALLESAGLPVIEHRLCRNEAQVQAAAAEFGRVVVKACSPDLPHKSDHGLVVLASGDPAAEFARMKARAAELGARFAGVIVARLAPKGYELALGARLDAQFGPVVLIGDGGVYLEALNDFRLLLPPFTEAEVLERLGELRVAPLLGAFRGRPARDVQAFARMAVRLGEAMLEWEGTVSLIDVNPVIVFETGQGAVAVDALVERLIISAP
ncbi:MAG: CoA-binding protein [Betaproteobacteria bacterium RIFCSPLOWO2_12_FULL_65_14]|nr:MAG: CoA-binding protein [Betaproteobacteria bacterium RIFCSPLOWO2_12_FULL_65_14]